MSDPVTRLNAALSGRYEPTSPSFLTLSVTTTPLPNAAPCFLLCRRGEASQFDRE